MVNHHLDPPLDFLVMLLTTYRESADSKWSMSALTLSTDVNVVMWVPQTTLKLSIKLMD